MYQTISAAQGALCAIVSVLDVVRSLMGGRRKRLVVRYQLKTALSLNITTLVRLIRLGVESSF